MQRLARRRIPRERTLATCGAICCFALAAASVPGRGGTNGVPATPGVASLREPARGPDIRPVEVRRDAFAPVGDVPDDAPPLHPASAAANAVRVTATISGAHPGAIVESPEGVRVVGTGDALDGSSVTAVTPTGLVLADGRILSIGAAAP
jgi:hypothetical protein